MCVCVQIMNTKLFFSLPLFMHAFKKGPENKALKKRVLKTRPSKKGPENEALKKGS